MELAHIQLIKHQNSSMTEAKCSVFKKLKSNTEITLTPYDKGRGTCITNCTDYLKVSLRHLASEHYTELKPDTIMRQSAHYKKQRYMTIHDYKTNRSALTKCTFSSK